MMRCAGLLAAALLLCASAQAAPEEAAAFAWQMHQGATIPLSAVLHDESGLKLPLSAAFAGRPVILDLGYFHCPTLCGIVRADLLAALTASGLVGGVNYQLISLSIDPAETADDAAAAKAADLAQAPSTTGAGWHYVIGTAADVAAIAQAVGFRFRYDPVFKQYLHPTGIVVLTKDGVISSYVQGVGYSGGDLRAAVLRAGTGGIAQASLPILLLCFHFDSTTGRYTLAIEKVLRLAGALTVLTVGGLLFLLHRKKPASMS